MEFNRLSISISLEDGNARAAVPESRVSSGPVSVSDHSNPKGSYVYAHFDEHGAIFYIGKGTGKRAWSKARQGLWLRYVEKHLNGKYEVRILADQMTSDEAEAYEAQLMAEHAQDLVNCVNVARLVDQVKVERYNTLRAANDSLIVRARELEEENPSLAVEEYKRAIHNIAAYALIDYESGLFGQLLREERQELGISGDWNVLDRLTLWLVRLGRAEEARDVVREYFELYKRDLTRPIARVIKRRVEKATEPRRRLPRSF